MECVVQLCLLFKSCYLFCLCLSSLNVCHLQTSRRWLKEEEVWWKPAYIRNSKCSNCWLSSNHCGCKVSKGGQDVLHVECCCFSHCKLGQNKRWLHHKHCTATELFCFVFLHFLSFYFFLPGLTHHGRSRAQVWVSTLHNDRLQPLPSTPLMTSRGFWGGGGLNIHRRLTPPSHGAAGVKSILS